MIPFGAAAVVVLPILWVSIDFVHRRRVLIAPDMFQTVLATLAAAQGQQYVGAWSRIGVNHPGPAWFYWAAPFSILFGHHPAAVVLAAGALAATGATVAILVVGRASGGVASMVAAAVLLVGLVQLNLIGVVAPWNPTIVIFPVLAGLVCTADTWSRGSRASAVGAVLFGGLVAQSHFGTVGLGMAIVMGGLLAAVFGGRRSGRPVTALFALLLALCVVVPWVPVAADQAFGEGNARSVATYAIAGTINGRPAHYKQGGSQRLGPVESVGHLASVTFLVQPDVALWAGIDVPAGRNHAPSRQSWVVGLLVLGLAAALARPTQRWPEGGRRHSAWLCRAGLVGFACQLVATLQIHDEFRPYLVVGSAGVGLTLWLGVTLGGLGWVRARVTAPLARRIPEVSMGVFMLVAAIALPRLDWRIEGASLPPRAPSTFRSLLAETDGAPVTLRTNAARLLDTYYTFTWELEQRDIPVSVRGPWSYRFSDRQRRLPFRGREVLLRDPAAPSRRDCTDVGRYRSVVICVRDQETP